MARILVRCCCTPVRVYGSLEVPDNLLRARAVVPFVLRQPAPCAWEAVDSTATERLHLEVAQFAEPGGTGMDPYRRSLALKYDGDHLTPAQKLETLRRIEGFEELPN